MKKIAFAVGLVLPLLFNQVVAQEVVHTEDPVSTSATVSIFSHNGSAVRHGRSKGVRRTNVYHRVTPRASKKHHRLGRLHHIAAPRAHKKGRVKSHHAKAVRHHVEVKHQQMARPARMTRHKLHRKPLHKVEVGHMKLKPLMGVRKHQVKIHAPQHIQQAHHDKKAVVLKPQHRSQISAHPSMISKVKQRPSAHKHK